MSWATVSANLDFATSSSGWATSNGLTAFSSGEEAAILNALQALYNSSPEAQNALEAAAGSSVLHIGKSSIPAGVWASNIIGYNLPKISDIHYFNSKGSLVPEILGLSLIHEIIHVAYWRIADRTRSLNKLNSRQNRTHPLPLNLAFHGTSCSLFVHVYPARHGRPARPCPGSVDRAGPGVG